MKLMIKFNEILAKTSIFICFAILMAAIPFLRTSAEGHKIIVVSDPHVMAEELLVNNGMAFKNYLSSRKNMVDYSTAIFDKIVAEIIAMYPKPELVLLLGDLSKDGELASHQYVKKKLDDLKDAGIPSLVIPGNHDYGKRSTCVYYDGDSTCAAANCVRFGSAENSLETIYADYGFKTYYKGAAIASMSVERESEQSTLTYACEPIDDLVIIGIDCGNTGGGIF